MGTSLSLQDNGAGAITVDSNGPFTFPTRLASGATYSVTLGAQPVHQTCTVTQGMGTVTGNVGTVAVRCVADPSYALVANQADNDVSVYSIDAASGALTQVAGSPFAAGLFPLGVAVNPLGTLAFAVNNSSNNVSVYSIDAATGALTQVAGSPFADGARPFSVAVAQP